MWRVALLGATVAVTACSTEGKTDPAEQSCTFALEVTGRSGSFETEQLRTDDITDVRLRSSAGNMRGDGARSSIHLPENQNRLDAVLRDCARLGRNR